MTRIRHMKVEARGLLKFVHIGMILALIGAAVAAATESDMYKGYELPPYAVLDADGDLELRRYEPHILAEVRVNGSQGQAVSRGFQLLANYIFGGNTSGEKIAMTVPVGQAPTESGSQTWTVSFMMPASFSLDTLPGAKSEAIRFVETGEEELLVVQFSGFRNASALAKKSALVTQEASRRGYQVAGAPRYFFYDGPMTPPWSRRNEVALPVTR
ncbi:MAG: heme-binding protein [Pseudomonadota bacterium]